MRTNIFRDRLMSSIDNCLAEAESCAQIDHAGLKGRLRELVVANLLKPMLPEGFHIGTGKITDHRGNFSGETDILVYNKKSIPPVLYDEKSGIFPIEIVHYVIEVKSQSTKHEVNKSIENGKKLRALNGPAPISAFFAFKSDVVSNPEHERFIKPQRDIKVPLPIDTFCVATREYGHWNNRWNLYAHDHPSEVVRAFLVGTLNTLASIAVGKSPLEPGWYFYPEVDRPE